MKTKKFKNKLNLNKETIANMDLRFIRGGQEDFSQASPTDCETCGETGGGGVSNQSCIGDGGCFYHSDPGFPC
jgi:hypothetical protein